MRRGSRPGGRASGTRAAPHRRRFPAGLLVLAGLLAGPDPAGAAGPRSLAVPETELLASDAAGGDQLGRSVSLSGTTLVAGAHYDDDAGIDSGSAYVFTLDPVGGTWVQRSKLTASDAAPGDELGTSIAISSDTLVVGAYGDDDAGSFSGAAYVFARDPGGAGGFTQVAKLTASDAAASDFFGWSASIDGDTLVVGAYGDDDAGSSSGAAYVFARDPGGAGSFSQAAKLTASDAAASDFFGWSVSISGDTLVVGAYGDDDAGAESGAAYVFARNQGGAGSWGQVAKLTASDAATGDLFGSSVSISGSIVAVGARWDDDRGAQSGSVLLFERNAGGAESWGEIRKLTASDGQAQDQFSSVAIDGDTLVVGAYFHQDPAFRAGAIYVFLRDQGGAGSWGELTEIGASDAEAWDNFGLSVAASGDRVVAGSPGGGPPGIDSGSAYVYRLPPPECGNGVIEVGETCDPGPPGSACCSTSCQLEPASTVCRPGTGPCDLEETCSGADPDCPPDLESTAECRPAAGECDLAEYCDGVSDTCPADLKSTAECRPAAGPCDSPEQCDGVSDVCPADLPDPDTDGDGVLDPCDPCPLDFPDDTDGDGVCDSDDPCPLDNPDDTDGDGVCDSDDLCPGYDDLADQDADGAPDGCDPCPVDPLDDSDGDGVCDSDDPCPLDNPDDTDGDGVCDSDDACPGANDRADADADGLPDACDPCPFDTGNDADLDGYCESADNCPEIANPDQLDSDGDGTGDACDLCPGGADTPDTDGDGVPDACDACPGADDTADADADGIPDACDSCAFDSANDEDGDGVCANQDNCPTRANGDQLDTDGDGVGEACDNCPDRSNPAQADSGGVRGPSNPDGATPDGIGDACQCGDVSDEGTVDGLDVQLLREALTDPNQLPLPGAAKCAVAGLPGSCGILDLTVLRRTIEGPALPPGLSPVCGSSP